MNRFLLFICFAVAAIVAMARPHFTPAETVPLYSSTKEAARYEVGVCYNFADEVDFEVSIGNNEFTLPKDSLLYEFCNDKKWVILTFGHDGKTAYAPAKYFKVECYEPPVCRQSDGLAVYEVTEEGTFLFDSGVRGTASVGDVMLVERLNDDGTVRARYREEWGLLESGTVAPSQKEYVLPEFRGFTWNDFKNMVPYFLFIAVPLFVLIFIVDRRYKKQVFERGDKSVTLDVISGLLFLVAIVAYVVTYYFVTGRVVFSDLFMFSVNSQNAGLIIVFIYALVLFVITFVWSILLWRVFRFGNDIVMYCITALVVTTMAVYMVIDCFIYSIFWGIVSIFVVGASGYFSFMTYCGFIAGRCPVCHSIGNDICMERDEDLGDTVEHSVESNTWTQGGGGDSGENWSETVSHDITEDYDVVTTTSHHRHYYHCLKCHERWSKETSNITDVKKSIKSRRINTTTKRTEWEKRKKW